MNSYRETSNKRKEFRQSKDEPETPQHRKKAVRNARPFRVMEKAKKGHGLFREPWCVYRCRTREEAEKMLKKKAREIVAKWYDIWIEEDKDE